MGDCQNYESIQRQKEVTTKASSSARVSAVLRTNVVVEEVALDGKTTKLIDH